MQGKFSRKSFTIMLSYFATKYRDFGVFFGVAARLSWPFACPLRYKNRNSAFRRGNYLVNQLKDKVKTIHYNRLSQMNFQTTLIYIISYFYNATY